MVGGLDHDKSPFNRVVQAHRQPGSSFKAFVYGAAVERGVKPTDIRQDAPISYAGWNPENYGHSYAGAVTLAPALARSLNTVAVRLTLEVGPDRWPTSPAGSASPTSRPTLARRSRSGAYEVTPLEMAAGYQVFQNGGGRTTPYLISEIRSTRGDVIYAHAASAPTPVLDPLYATRMVEMLKGVITAGTGTGANIGRPAAGKTGTSQDWRDAWFVGFTPDLLTAVWVGNDNGAPMAKVTGGELPARSGALHDRGREGPRPRLPLAGARAAGADLDETEPEGADEDEPPVVDGAEAGPSPGRGQLAIDDPSGDAAARQSEGDDDAPPADDPPPPRSIRRSQGYDEAPPAEDPPPPWRSPPHRSPPAVRESSLATATTPAAAIAATPTN